MLKCCKLRVNNVEYTTNLNPLHLHHITACELAQLSRLFVYVTIASD